MEEDMDALASFEIYIPAEAEVKLIPLWSLPNYALRRLGLAQPGGDVSKNLEDSPKATWISPVVVRERGKENGAGDSAKVNMASLMKKGLEAAQGPFQMPFVSSNYTAYGVLSKFLPAGKISRQLTRTSLLPRGSPANIHQDAVIIYSRRIYVSIRKPKPVRCQGETHKSKPAPATPSQQSRPASPESEDSEFVNVKRRSLKRRCLTHQAKVSLPKLKDLKSLFHSTKEPQDTIPASKRKRTLDEDQSVDQEAGAPSSNSTPVSETEKEEASEERAAERAVEQVSDDDAGSRGEQAEEVGDHASDGETLSKDSDSAPVIQTEKEDTSEERAMEQVSDDDAGRWQNGGEEAEDIGGDNETKDSGYGAKTMDDDCGKGVNVFGLTEDSVALRHRPSFTLEFDFDQMAQEEMIACTKAQLEAALKDLC